MKIWRNFVISFVVTAFVLGVFRMSVLHAVTAVYNSTVRIVDASGNVIGGVASATTAVYNSTVQVVDATGHVLNSLGVGGTGVGAPAWGRSYFDGNEGPVTTTTGSFGGVHFVTTWACNGTLSFIGVPAYLVVYATTSITLSSSCVIPANNSQNGGVGFMGGQGGTGGSGTAAGNPGFAMTSFGFSAVGSFINYLAAPTAATAGGNPGNNGNVEPLYVNQQFLLMGPGGWIENGSQCGGGLGSAGSSSGGARGKGGSCVALIAPSITIANGALINAQGGDGVDATASTQGGGGAGGGGDIWLMYQNLVDNSAGTYFKIGGGAPGGCTTPSIQIDNAPGDSTGFGAQVVVTGLTGGGIDASKVTITGGSGYTIAPICTVIAGASGLNGSPTCTTHLTAGVVDSIIVGTAGANGTLSTFTTCGVGGSGRPGYFKALQAQ